MIDARGAIPHSEAVHLLLQICSAMAHAHANGVLHRDLKPDNVMIIDEPGSPPVAKVIDFGLSKLVDGIPGQRLTRTGEVVGDPRYMSPEQCRGDLLDERSDVYSFGCLMYELLTGMIPFNAADPVAIMQKQLEEDALPFAPEREVPEALEAITFIALSKDRGDRYESFADITEALTKFVASPDMKVAVPKRRKNKSQRLPLKISLVTGAIVAIAIAFLGAMALRANESLIGRDYRQVCFTNLVMVAISWTLRWSLPRFGIHIGTSRPQSNCFRRRLSWLTTQVLELNERGASYFSLRQR